MSPFSFPCVFLIRVYQATLSPWLGGHCRFEPTCSRYAIEAYRHFGPARGTFLTIRRLLRCHPFGGSGYDPVPVEPDRPLTAKSPEHPMGEAE